MRRPRSPWISSAPAWWRQRGACLALGALLAACSSPQAYHAGQAWQRNECRKLPAQEQQRCLASNAMSFEDYQRQAEAATKPK